MATRTIARTTDPVVGWDGVGVFWSVLSVVWTAGLVSCMLFLHARRDMPHLRIRSLPLCFGAVTMLHIYWLCCTLAYIYGALMPKVIEFWIMSIWLPFGIGLFQASNAEFLHVSRAQRRFAKRASLESFESEKTAVVHGRWAFLKKFRQLDYPRKVLVYVCIGMTVQVSSLPVSSVMSRLVGKPPGTNTL